MIFSGSLINICDKSGVKIVKYISGFFYKSPGFIVKGICNKIKRKKKFIKGDLVSVFIVSTNTQYRRNSRFFKSFFLAGLILDKAGNPAGKIICKFFCRSLRRRSFLKILSLTRGYIV